TLHPKSYTIHPPPSTLHPTPYTPHPASHTLHPIPYSPHPTPCNTHRPAPLPFVAGKPHTTKQQRPPRSWP
ncbi:hypothetical protein T484DRAFT_1642513, partial [Baffinella frigidus]